MNEKCKFNYVNIHRVFKSLVIKTQFEILASFARQLFGRLSSASAKESMKRMLISKHLH